MNLVKLREQLDERFGSEGWLFTLWENGYVMMKNIQITRGDTVCLYVCEKGNCGVVENLELNNVLANLAHFKEHERLYENGYKNGKYESEIFRKLLVWCDVNEKPVVVNEEFFNEEFDDELKKVVIEDFEDFIQIVKS